MTEVWLRAALWLGLALAATLLSIRLRVATALSEIVVGTVAQLLIGAFVGTALLGTTEGWITFLSATGAVFLTFLAGAELDPAVLRTKWRETGVMGLVSFAAPFLGCTAYAYFVLGWSSQASWLTGVALSTTSVAVVYAVMLELGLNSTGFGKAVLAACFVCDLGTVVALGLIFAPFTYRTLVFAVATAIVIGVLPWVTPRFFRAFGGRPSELEAKYLLLVLFALGGLAAWADSEAVLPAYLVGMVLAGTVGKDHALVRRLRTLTFGLLTPFYFIRAGSFVSVPALVAAPGVVGGLLLSKLAAKTLVWPITRFFRYPPTEAAYATLLMSTGLTFGSISALFGLTHRIIDQSQYSYLIATVIGSAVVPTLVANAWFLPRYLLPKMETPSPAAALPPAAAVGDPEG
jgi:Kef-type K+ transport system membrane component KefB